MYTIKEVSKKMDVSEHTLRFWAKCDFFPFVARDKNNIRKFSEQDLEWVRIVKCLRGIGTDSKSIKRYVDLCLIGDSTISDRYEIIKSTKKKALMQLIEAKKQMELLELKENYYKELIKNNTNDKFNPINNMQLAN